MIQIDQIRISVTEKHKEQRLREKICRLLGVKEAQIEDVSVKKRSIDARKKPQVFYLYTVAVKVAKEDAILQRNKKKPHIGKLQETVYRLPERKGRPKQRPVVVGFGPAGMFAAYLLALAGAEPIVLERGQAVEQRRRDVERFFADGKLDPASNVQFGEGGAGTFSDGKLNTQKNDRQGRNRFVLETFCRFGADGDILYDAKPHIGTDRLVEVVANLRNEIIALGGEVRFSSQMDRLLVESGERSETQDDKPSGYHTEPLSADDERQYAAQTNRLSEGGRRIRGVRLTNGEAIETDRVILAIGHSARDTFETLRTQQIEMTAKPFAVGFRVEHPQELISVLQYGKEAAAVLPPAPYKLVAKGRTPALYSFCMCPGGYVINASSENDRLCVNGMSLKRRDSGNANSALVLPVGAESFDLSEPLSGMHFQRRLEERVFQLGGGRIPQQLFGDYLADRASSGFGRFTTRTKGQAAFANLRGLFSAEWENGFIEGVRAMDARMHGFWDEEMILSGVESRTSSPVRIPRDERFEGNVAGLYPCGEGAGYAGGITSAAMDGLKVAEAVLQSYG